jgi:hypothetical protein
MIKITCDLGTEQDYLISVEFRSKNLLLRFNLNLLFSGFNFQFAYNYWYEEIIDLGIVIHEEINAEILVNKYISWSRTSNQTYQRIFKRKYLNFGWLKK